MTNIIAQNVGVDICKATLDVHLHPAGSARQFANNAKGIRALLDWLGGHDIATLFLNQPGRTTTAFSDRLWNVNAILRWEFQPGSAFFFVYTHGVSSDALINARATISPRLDLPILRHLPSDDVVQMKISWLIR